ncbi:collagenase [Nonomuraea endophytica]|uniref:microbial collagenase n=1 Tax=Nonomuraea endophytica TaxID=714136 RepID=A0A7W8EJK8_9ACTN|nr:collagenase [Nonomuraea endophytica]MBB5081759.1 microbial collagenase [Nonomuraea endophytica]
MRIPLAGVIAGALMVSSLITAPGAQARQRVAPPPPAPAATEAPAGHHPGHKRLSPSQYPPLTGTGDDDLAEAHRPKDTPSLKASACSDDIVGKTGAALVTAVKAADIRTCLNPLFDLTPADARRTFTESQMLTIARDLRATAGSYPGDNSTSVQQLIVFLRAGYYTQANPYGPTLLSEVRGVFDTFFSSSRAYTNTDENGAVLKEAVWLIVNAQDEIRNIGVATRLLNAYSTAYGVNMRDAVNRAFELYWRSHTRGSMAQSDPAIRTALRDFAVRNFGLLNGDNYFLVVNAGKELAGFLRYGQLRNTVTPLVRDLLNRSRITGPTAALWVSTALVTNEYDGGACSSYGTCDLTNRLTDAALPISHPCSPTLTIRAQELTPAQLSSTCTSLLNQDAAFHSIVKDNGQPVPDDHTVRLEISVFDTKRDYSFYAWGIYGIDTDNGGMSLEYDPSQPGNVARFICYEQDREKPLYWEIWNLNHEYTHYLDAKYNMHGDFDEGMSTPTVWWVEGLAEYISYGYRKFAYTAAINAAGQHTYKLSQLFDTVYGDNARTYNWGYLAVRYMLDKHPADVARVLGYYRTGDWNAARTFLKGLDYDADFDAWLTACAAGACKASDENMLPTADFTVTASGTALSFTSTAADPDGTLAQYYWDFGDGTTSTTANPVKSYSSPGAYTVKLVVLDDKGAPWGVFKPVTVPAAGGTVPECTGDTRALGKNCKRGNLSVGQGQYAYLFIYLPAGVGTLTVASSGGTGDVDLYYNASTWATTSSYTQRATGSGNAHTLTVANPAAGYRYISLYGVAAASGVTVTTTY